MRKLTLALMVTAVAGLVTTIAPAASAEPSTGVPKVLHSFGYKNLLLGMSKEQAEATGLITHFASGRGCDFYTLVASEGDRQQNTIVAVTQGKGLSRIDATVPMKTPRGIGEGSSIDAMKSAYPNATADPEHDWIYDAEAPFNPGARYTFSTTSFGDRVFRMQLRTDYNIC